MRTLFYVLYRDGDLEKIWTKVLSKSKKRIIEEPNYKCNLGGFLRSSELFAGIFVSIIPES